MTRANTEKSTPWFAESGAACSIIPISRFVDGNVFASKGGGFGALFSLQGVDEEGQTDEQLDYLSRRIEGALRGLPHRCRDHLVVQIRDVHASGWKHDPGEGTGRPVDPLMRTVPHKSVP